MILRFAQKRGDIFMYITQDIANRIKSMLKKQNKNMKDMLSDLGLGVNAISEFSKGKQLSCISLAKIADYLNCSVDYLLGKTDFPTVVDEQLAKEEFALFGEVKELTDEEKQRVLDFIKFTKEQRKDK